MGDFFKGVDKIKVIRYNEIMILISPCVGSILVEGESYE